MSLLGQNSERRASSTARYGEAPTAPRQTLRGRFPNGGLGASPIVIGMALAAVVLGCLTQ